MLPEIKFGRCTTLSAVLFADDQVLFTEGEDDLGRSVFQLQTILQNCNINISEKEAKVLAT